MNLLILSTLLCLASYGSIAPVSGMFFELSDSKDDDFMGGIKQYFGSLTAAPATPDTNASHNKTAGQPVGASSSDFYDEVDTALEHATDTVDGLWQQFRKGLLSLMGSFSGGDDSSDVPTTTPSLQQMKPISSETSAISTTTTARAPTIIEIVTNKVITDADIPATEATTTTPGTSSTVPTTTVAPPSTSTPTSGPM
ncbi:mucin-5AC [Drosophila subobscura]|uniref:mucin-5AC n=1 Tax=Drosophila subobscura TaxID=7241 RepID=UPI00155B17B2|nr:mucin-5AC [Drosophila subobscura]